MVKKNKIREHDPEFTWIEVWSMATGNCNCEPPRKQQNDRYSRSTPGTDNLRGCTTYIFWASELSLPQKGEDGRLVKQPQPGDLHWCWARWFQLGRGLGWSDVGLVDLTAKTLEVRTALASLGFYSIFGPAVAECLWAHATPSGSENWTCGEWMVPYPSWGGKFSFLGNWYQSVLYAKYIALQNCIVDRSFGLLMYP